MLSCVLVFLGLFFSFSFLSPSVSFAAEIAPIISVGGSGVVEGTPDQATVRLGVVTRAKKADEAEAENASAAASIHRALAVMGIERRDIRTLGYSFRPEYSEEKSGQMRLSGYVVSNVIVVTVRDTARVGNVIDTALKNGANSVDSLDFSISDTMALRQDALRVAIRDAREKADVIAKELGVRIVGIQNVSENTHMFQPRAANMMKMARSEAADMGTVTPVEAGIIKLTAEVHVDFLIGTTA